MYSFLKALGFIQIGNNCFEKESGELSTDIDEVEGNYFISTSQMNWDLGEVDKYYHAQILPWQGQWILATFFEGRARWDRHWQFLAAFPSAEEGVRAALELIETTALGE